MLKQCSDCAIEYDEIRAKIDALENEYSEVEDYEDDHYLVTTKRILPYVLIRIFSLILMNLSLFLLMIILN